jgi:hypothetical protein
MGLTFDVLPSRAIGLRAALMRMGGILLVRAERLTGVALIPVDTLCTLNYMTTIMSAYRKVSMVKTYSSVLRSRLAKIILTPLPCVES